MRQSINDQLNNHPSARNKYCDRCKCATSVLNIEAVIHHGAAVLECVDRKACRRRQRRLNK